MSSNDRIKHAIKKPVEIEYMVWDGTYKCAKDIVAWSHGSAYIDGKDDDMCSLYIDTLEGLMSASAGDRIIKGVDGEFYPCKKSIFEKTYKEV